jgi:hypothetical protein
MAAWRSASILGLLLLPAAGYGQTFNLTETPKAGECFQVTIETKLTGALKVTQDGKENTIPIKAANLHGFVERTLVAEADVVRKSARYYDKASSQANIGDESTQRTLRDLRRLIVAQRPEGRLLCYCPGGPLSRTELEVVSEHFDTLCLTALLPAKEVAINEGWKIGDAAAQAFCLFDGLISHDLGAKLTEVKEGQALIAVSGKASGIELGASVKLEITAVARFDLLKRRLVALEWKQKDVRDLGPASPASELQSETVVKRALLDEEPRELSKASLVGVPQDDKPQELLQLLEHKDPKGRYAFLYARDWQVVAQTDNHLVLRLLDRGDFVAQATISVWRKEEAGQHTSIDDFKKQIAASPNWEMEEVSEAGEVPTDEGRWMYRLTARGDLDGAKVLQTFILLAGPRGDQVAVTFTMKPANASKIGTRDLALVNSIEFMKK